MKKHGRRKPIIIFLLLTIPLYLAACSGQESPPATAISQQPTAAPTEDPTATPPPPTAESTATTAPTAAPMAEPQIDDQEAVQLMNSISTGNPTEVNDALQRIAAANDRRFIPVLIDAFRGWQLRLLRVASAARILETLQGLSGQSYGSNWPAWVEWYGNTDITPPPGFTGWKGRMLSQIDPRFGQFLSDDHAPAADLRPEEIQWGGVVVDGIPALDNPKMLEADKASYLNPEDVVFGLYINNEARAYPLRILDWHEMANDVIGGVPVSLAYCTLCGAAIAYDGRAPDGSTFTFGSSGFLYRSNKLMYDRQTNTLWNQLTGQPVLGELVSQDITLDLLPVILTTWREWQNQHPDTLVVDQDTGFPRNYTPGAAYGNYFAAEETMFPVPQRSDLLEDKEQIFAMRLNGVPKAYPLTTLTEEIVVNDTLGGSDVALIAPNGLIEVAGDNQYVGPVTYQAGAEVRAYERQGIQFMSGPDQDTLIDQDGQTWQISEEALSGPDGMTLPRLPGHLAYWFGWFAFFPDTEVYGK